VKLSHSKYKSSGKKLLFHMKRVRENQRWQRNQRAANNERFEAYLREQRDRRAQRLRLGRELRTAAAIMENRILTRINRGQEQLRQEQARLARAAEAIPLYNVATTDADGSLHTLSLTPMTTGGPDYSLEAAQLDVAVSLRVFTRNIIVNRTGWTAVQADERISGFVQATNTMNAQVNRRYRFDRLSDITQDRLMEMFEQMHVSETEIPFEAIEWTVVINPKSYEFGAGLNLAFLKDRKRGILSWDQYEDDRGIHMLTRQNQLCSNSSNFGCFSKQELQV